MSDPLPPLSPEAQNFRHGIYRHFKGGMYKTICIGRFSETRHEEYVVYQSVELGHIWIRPLSMFLSEVDRPGYRGPRFTWLGKASAKMTL